MQKSSPKVSTLSELFVEELKDIYSAEKQLVEALPKMAQNATSSELREAFESHLEETEEHVARLERIGEKWETSLGGKKCKAMQGLIEEASELFKEDIVPEVLDAALIIAAQKVEHYEIAAYGSLRAFAEELGYDETAEILSTTLDEESAADDKLTDLSEDINSTAHIDSDDEIEKASSKVKSKKQSMKSGS